VLAMARRLPVWRAEVGTDLAGRGLTRKRVLAAALRMLDRGIFRTGGEEYAEENGTHGVATLLREHAHVRGDECTFR
jgi:DNA topoisomerase-1